MCSNDDIDSPISLNHSQDIPPKAVIAAHRGWQKSMGSHHSGSICIKVHCNCSILIYAVHLHLYVNKRKRSTKWIMLTVHSLKLSCHDLRSLPLWQLPSTVRCNLIFGRVSWRQTCLNHDNLECLTLDSKSSWRPARMLTCCHSDLFCILCMIYCWKLLFCSLCLDAA